MLRDFREFLSWRKGDAIILRRPTCCRSRISTISATMPTAMNMMFNFQVNQATFYALAAHDTRHLVKAIERRSRAPYPVNGASSCAITTSWISVASRRHSGKRCSLRSGPTSGCNSTTVASAAGSRQ